MAVIIEFDPEKIDYPAYIMQKFDTDPFECARVCRQALELELKDDDERLVRIYLAKCYIEFDEIGYALLELKKNLIKFEKDHETIKLLVMCLTENGYPNAYATSMEYFHDVSESDEEGSSPEDVFSMAYDSIEYDDRISVENSNLYIVSKDDYKDRVAERANEFHMRDQHNKALETLLKSAVKLGDSIEIKELIARAYFLSGDSESAHATAKEIMRTVNNSPAALFLFLTTLAETNIDRSKLDKSEMEFALNYINRIVIEDIAKLHMSVISIMYVFDASVARKLMDRCAEMRNHCLYRKIEAFLDYAMGDTDGAIAKLKTVQAIYGDRSYARDCIESYSSDDIEVTSETLDFTPLNVIISLELKLTMEIKKYKEAIRYNYEYDCKVILDIMRVAILCDEVKLMEKMLKKVGSDFLLTWWDEFQEFVLDEELVTCEMRTLILQNMLLYGEELAVFYSYNNRVDKCEFDLDMYQNLPANYCEAYAKASAIAYCNVYDDMGCIKKSFDKVLSLMGDKVEQYNEVKPLAALIGLGTYLYYAEEDIFKYVAKLHNTSLAKLKLYLGLVNTKGKFYSEGELHERVLYKLNKIIEQFGDVEEIGRELPGKYCGGEGYNFFDDSDDDDDGVDSDDDDTDDDSSEDNGDTDINGSDGDNYCGSEGYTFSNDNNASESSDGGNDNSVKKSDKNIRKKKK